MFPRFPAGTSTSPCFEVYRRDWTLARRVVDWAASHVPYLQLQHFCALACPGPGQTLTLNEFFRRFLERWRTWTCHSGSLSGIFKAFSNDVKLQKHLKGDFPSGCISNMLFPWFFWRRLVTSMSNPLSTPDLCLDLGEIHYWILLGGFSISALIRILIQLLHLYTSKIF